MKTPKDKVIIGAHVFNIEYRKVLKSGKDFLLGFCDSNKNKIILSKELENTKKETVFLHECLHAISAIYDLNLNERQVSVLGEILPEFLTKNGIIPKTRKNEQSKVPARTKKHSNHK